MFSLPNRLARIKKNVYNEIAKEVEEQIFKLLAVLYSRYEKRRKTLKPETVSRLRKSALALERGESRVTS